MEYLRYICSVRLFLATGGCSGASGAAMGACERSLVGPARGSPEFYLKGRRRYIKNWKKKIY